MSELIAFDTFAGTGWGVACHWLGIREYGVELMPEAVATRDAVGMTTVYRDVWDGILDPAKVPAHDLKISSPPCQTFSAAGNGDGRRALGDVLAAVKAGVYMRPLDLYELTKSLDPRTALVLTPLAHIYRERPRLVALEQVPQVLPVWEAYAAVMREWGYSVAVGVLNAEQYGVPQTRRRAILVARRDGREARLPTPTHSRYYSHDPKRLDEGVLPWVSMADALGMENFDLVGNQITPGAARGDYHSRGSDFPAQTVTGNAGLFKLRSNYSSGSSTGEAPEGNKLPRTERPIDEPATTITSKAWVGDTRRLSIEEAAVLQSYPQVVYRNGNQANAAQRPLMAPAPTVMFGARSNKVEWMDPALADDPSASGIRVSVDEAATFQSYPSLFPFQGAKGNQFLQVGNAVPPLMAAAILAELIAPPEPLDEWQTAFLGSTADHLAA